MKRTVLLLALGLAGCGAERAGPSDADVERIAREAFLGQTYSNSFGGANPMACASHFEVRDAEVLDRQLSEFSGQKYATVAVRLEVRATTAFPYEYSCSWSTQSDTGTRGFWQQGETRGLTRSLNFTQWESGWRLSG